MGLSNSSRIKITTVKKFTKKVYFYNFLYIIRCVNKKHCKVIWELRGIDML